MLRASVAAGFLPGEPMSLALPLGAGQIDFAQDWAAFAPLAGLWLSRVNHARIGGKGLRIFVLALAAASGLFSMARPTGGAQALQGGRWPPGGRGLANA